MASPEPEPEPEPAADWEALADGDAFPALPLAEAAEEALPESAPALEGAPGAEDAAATLRRLQEASDARQRELGMPRGVVARTAPVLLVDLKTLCGFAANGSDAPILAARVADELFEDWTGRVDELFEIGAARCSERAAAPPSAAAGAGDDDDALDAVTVTSGSRGQRLAVIPFPAAIGGRSVRAELWPILVTPSRWPPVAAIKQALLKTGRDLAWKADLSDMLEGMADEAVRVRRARQAKAQTSMLGGWRTERAGKMAQLQETRAVFERRLEAEEADMLRAAAAPANDDDLGAAASGDGGEEVYLDAAGDAEAGKRNARAYAAQLEKKLEQIDELLFQLEDEVLAEEEAAEAEMKRRLEKAGRTPAQVDAIVRAHRGEATNAGRAPAPPQPSAKEAADALAAEAAAMGLPPPPPPGPRKLGPGASTRRLPRPAAAPDAAAVAKAEKEAEAAAAAAAAEADGGGAGAPSVLDDILAMVLGRLPRLADDDAVHYDFVRTQHAQLKKGWYDEFGSLPPVRGGAAGGS